MWFKIILVTVTGLAIVISAALIYGSRRWQAAAREMHAGLEAASLPISPTIYDSRELAGLPSPVQRFFRTVLKDGQPIVADVRIEHAGTFKMSDTAEQWKQFASAQRVITRRPGFDWEGRIKMMPGLTVLVHDAYIFGEGILHASLFGLVSLANLSDRQEMARGELMRFFAEAVWYPTALLPSQGVDWEPIDDSSAAATLKDGEITVTMLFRFDDRGLIESVRAEARGRAVEGVMVPTPWEGWFSDYELRGGMLIPLKGEVAWMLPDGPRQYWRGRISGINYMFAE